MNGAADYETLTARIDQAAQLLVSALELVRIWKVTTAGDEMRRRRVIVLSRGLRSITKDLGARLELLAIDVDAKRCPHCGWIVPPRSVARCPRCNLPREVPRETPRGDRRRAS